MQNYAIPVWNVYNDNSLRANRFPRKEKPNGEFFFSEWLETIKYAYYEKG